MLRAGGRAPFRCGVVGALQSSVVPPLIATRFSVYQRVALWIEVDECAVRVPFETVVVYIALIRAWKTVQIARVFVKVRVVVPCRRCGCIMPVYDCITSCLLEAQRFALFHAGVCILCK